MLGSIRLPSPAIRAWALALSLALTLPLTGCVRMGMRPYNSEKLEEKYKLPNSRFMRVDNTRIHYVVDGNPNGPVVVLLHGVLASVHTWDGWIDALGRDHMIIRMDLPGFGLSDNLASEDYSVEYAVEFFEITRERLEDEFGAKARKFHLVGNSLGGFLAWFYATRYPQRVDKLILIDPIAYQQPLPRIIKFASGWFGGNMAETASPRFIVKNNVHKVYGTEKPSRETVNRYHDLLMKDGHRQAMVDYFRALRKYNEEDSVARFVPEIGAPTLLMWGGKDRWVPPELIDKWKADVPDLEVRVYEDGGHIPMEEYPERTVRDALAFLQSGAPSPAVPPADYDSPAPAEPAPIADDPEAGFGDPEAGMDEPAEGFDDPEAGFDDPEAGASDSDSSGGMPAW